MATRRFVSIVGARPQFIKAAVFSRAVRARHTEVLVHTGQHYDPQLSDVFFREMGIPQPEVRLESGSGTHAEQTAAMLVGLERVLVEERPDWVITFGDTNSTLAGALAAAKVGLPVAHVEAGLRSFNRSMPEEINRVLVDHLSQALFCPSTVAVENLAAEGIRSGVHLVGDVMAEALELARPVALARSRALSEMNVEPGAYVLVTVHRAENTDNAARLARISTALNALDEPVVFTVHPRTRKALEQIGYVPAAHVRLVPPLGYLDMVRLLTSARLVVTDSGGLQKEAYWSSVPCVTLRDETEWTETVAHGWNVLVGTDPGRIVSAIRGVVRPVDHPVLYGQAGVAERCVTLLENVSTTSASAASRRVAELIR
jgi:UDP-N-acetylglucosamine 2-epimerase